MANEIKRIKKIKLGGNTYSIFDETALRLDENNNLTVGKLTMSETPEAEQAASSILVQGEDGMVMARPTDKLLEDIGGFSCEVVDGVFKVKLGK